jgi:putative sterol carrier protein
MPETTVIDDTATAFFEELSERQHEPLVAKGHGTVCIELIDGKKTQPWLVTIDHGDLDVFQGTGNADCTLRGSRELFEQIFRGEANAVAAALRGAVAIEGDWQLLVLFQRLFHGKGASQ